MIVSEKVKEKRIERRDKAQRNIETLVQIFDERGRFSYKEVPGTCKFGNCYGNSRWHDHFYDEGLCGECLRKRLVAEATFGIPDRITMELEK